MLKKLLRLKYEFVDCKQSNKTYKIIISCSILFSAYNLFVSNNTCLLDLYRGERQTTTVSFGRNFTQGWLNSYYSLLALSWPFICASDQSDEGSWSGTFGVSISREFHIFVCVLYTQCFWLLSHTFLPIFLSYCCCWFVQALVPSWLWRFELHRKFFKTFKPTVRSRYSRKYSFHSRL